MSAGIRADDLERQRQVQLAIPHVIHRAHAAGPEQADDLVALTEGLTRRQARRAAARGGCAGRGQDGLLVDATADALGVGQSGLRRLRRGRRRIAKAWQRRRADVANRRGIGSVTSADWATGSSVRRGRVSLAPGSEDYPSSSGV